MVEVVIAAQADELDRRIVESPANFLTLLVIERRLDAVGMSRAKLDAEHTRLFAVRDQRRQVPVVPPSVGNQAKTQLRIRRRSAEGRTKSESHRRRARRCLNESPTIESTILH